MDYKTESEKLKQELLNLGFTEDKFQQLLELAAEEALDIAVLDLSKKDASVLEALEKRLSEEVNSIEVANQNIDMIFYAAYEDRAEDMKSQLILEYLEITIEETKKAKDLFERYQAEDPTAVSTINANKDNPELQEILEQLSTSRDGSS